MGEEKAKTEEAEPLQMEMGGNENGSMEQGKKKKMVILALAVVLVIVIIAVVLGLVLSLGGVGGDHIPSHCDEPSYTNVTVSLRDGRESFLKFKFALVNDDGYKFADAKEACQEEQAELWEVRSEEEWKSVLSVVDAKYEFWIDMKVDENCPEGALATCKEAEAQRGEGLQVILPSNGLPAPYSRSQGGLDTKCLVVKQTSNGEVGENSLWRKDECDILYARACVKRDCEVKINEN